MNEELIILIAGEEPYARAATVQKLRDGLGTVQVIEAGTMWEAARQCERLPRLDFIVFDAQLVESVGTRFLSGILSLKAEARLVVIGPPRAREAAIKMLEAGAVAYLPSDLGATDIAKAFDAVLSGAIFAPIPPARAKEGTAAAPRAVVVPFPGVRAEARQLTRRQREVLSLLAQGRSNAEIGARLGLSDDSVKVHVGTLLHYLGLNDRLRPERPAGEGANDRHHSDPDTPPT